MQLSKLIAEYGDENVKFQTLDSCFIEAKIAKGHNKVTFGTDASFNHKGMVQLGIVVWMDRDKIDAILNHRHPDPIPMRQKDSPLNFAPHHHQKILDSTKIWTARKRDKTGEFIINGKRFLATFEIAMTNNAFISLFESDFYTPEQFGFESKLEMWSYYSDYFLRDELIYVHKIEEVTNG